MPAGNSGFFIMQHLDEISPNPGLDVVRVIITNASNQVLLVQEADDRNWKLPGGKIEPGETVLEAIVRELQEELGLTQISHSDITKLIKANIPDSEHYRYIVRLSLDSLAITPTPEVAEAKFFQANQLPPTKFSKHILSALELTA